MNQIIETERLILRAFNKSDIDPLFEIQRDTEAMRHTFCATTRDDSERYLRAYSYKLNENGFAPWTVCLDSIAHVIGWGGLSIDPFEAGYGTEVSYFFHKEYWGQGFASELVRASVVHGFTSLNLDVIGAFARNDNLGSIRVLRKCGFNLLGYNQDLQRNQYEIKQVPENYRHTR
ncbi:MAG: GNAT family N-acetyltransferase [Pseudomonadales bacterium]|nr:GNAT family N-acetyltransferase [Pseudomonadales bacterium]